jgi:hypothetical protein
MMSTMREETTVSSENSTEIMSIRREVTKRKDISTQNKMRSIMERRAITKRDTMMMITRATVKNKAKNSTTDMKKIIVKRVAVMKEIVGHIVGAREVVVDMEAVGMEAVGMEAVGMEAVGMEAVGMEVVGMEAAGMEAVGTEEDVEGTEVENTEMEITKAVDMEMEHNEVDMAVDTAETIVVVVVVVTVSEIT